MKLTALITLSLFSLTLSANAQELPPGPVFVGQPYTYSDEVNFNKTTPIENIECLVYGQNVQRKEACEYYKADFHLNTYPETPPIQLCFKEVTGVSYPRIYKAENNYRLWFNGGPIIISEKPDLNLDKRPAHHPNHFPSGSGAPKNIVEKPKHAVTQIILSNCNTEVNDNPFN